MTEIDKIEYAAVQIKIRRLEEKMSDWKKQRSVIDHILGLLEGCWSEAVKHEQEIQIRNGISAGRGA